jgi:hypothetical protein
MVVIMRKSKTDQEGSSRRIGIPYGVERRNSVSGLR